MPSLLAYNLSPSPTYLNQALAFALWVGFAMVTVAGRPGRGPWAVWLAPYLRPIHVNELALSVSTCGGLKISPHIPPKISP